ncbi:hypothetical protein KSP39_PZI009688 [Platanthera zijinensis]|uniref:Uncharacterized protein n=1 Tax=Platanthera zijinensis TaxID=2320716 RepID=A0AAP0BL72_9ASPA
MSIVVYIATTINSFLFPLTKHPLFLRSSGTGTEIGAFSTLLTLVTGGFRGRPGLSQGNLVVQSDANVDLLIGIPQRRCFSSHAGLGGACTRALGLSFFRTQSTDLAIDCLISGRVTTTLSSKDA